MAQAEGLTPSDVAAAPAAHRDFHHQRVDNVFSYTFIHYTNQADLTRLHQRFKHKERAALNFKLYRKLQLEIKYICSAS